MSVTPSIFRRLKLVAAKVYGTETQCACDSGAISNIRTYVMSADFAKDFSIKPAPADRGESMLDCIRSDSIVYCLVENVSVSFGERSGRLSSCLGLLTTS